MTTSPRTRVTTPVPDRRRTLAALCGMAFVAMLAQELAAYRGLSQRLAEAAIFLWIAGVSAFVLRMR